MTIQFRTEADERRYLALRTEIVARLMQCPIEVAHEILRNIGKLEAFVFAEGVRQGTVATLLTLADSQGDTPLGVHARVYAGASTPLTRAERGFLEGRGADADALLANPIFDATPTRFAPTTLAEAIAEYGPALVPSGVPLTRPARAPAPAAPAPTPVAEPDPLDDLTELGGPLSDDQLEQLLGVDVPSAGPVDHAAVLAAIENGDIEQAEIMLAGRGQTPFAAPEQGDIPAESPDAIDRIRDQLQALLRSGEWKPKTWGEVIYKLHVAMNWDASFLDLQLSGPMGHAVLAQAGLIDIQPGVGAIFTPEGQLEAKG